MISLAPVRPRNRIKLIFELKNRSDLASLNRRFTPVKYSYHLHGEWKLSQSISWSDRGQRNQNLFWFHSCFYGYLLLWVWTDCWLWNFQLDYSTPRNCAGIFYFPQSQSKVPKKHIVSNFVLKSTEKFVLFKE